MEKICLNSLTVDEWNKNKCTNFLLTLKSDAKDNFFSQLFENYTIAIPGTDNFTQDNLNFQYLLSQLCGTSPDLAAIGNTSCTVPLIKLCKNYKRSDLENPVLRKVCGCYLQPSEYLNNAPQCDPICSGIDTIKLFDNNKTGIPIRCSQNLCVIDDITLSIQNSSVGQLTFNEVCTSCSSSGCKCIFGDINITSTNSQIQGIDFTKECNQGTVCYIKNQDGTQTQTDCTNYFNTLSQKNNTSQFNLTIILVVIIFLLFLMLCIYIFLNK